MLDLPADAQAARLTENALGLIGAICVDSWPAHGVCGTFRMAGDRLEPSGGIHLIDLSPAIKPKTPTPKKTMNYTLKESLSGQIVLVSDWAREGAQYRADSTLPHQSGGQTARDFVMQWLLKPKGEPGLTSEPADEFDTLAFEFISTGMTPENLRFAEVYFELRSKGVALPPVKLGPSQWAA